MIRRRLRESIIPYTANKIQGRPSDIIRTIKSSGYLFIEDGHQTQVHREATVNAQRHAEAIAADASLLVRTFEKAAVCYASLLCGSRSLKSTLEGRYL